MKNEQGIFHVPCALLLLAISAASLGIWATFHEWHSRVKLQLRLDRCVGEKAHALAQNLREIDRDNRLIEETRASSLAASEAPPVAAALRATLELIVAHQESLRWRWRAAQLSWLAQGGCGGGRDQAEPIADLPFMPLREPPDALGARPLRYSNPNAITRLTLRRANRASAALIERKDSMNDFDRSSQPWQAHWTSASWATQPGKRSARLPWPSTR